MEKTERILIAEDDIGISTMIKLELDHEGYVSEIASDGKIAMEKFAADQWDIVLLDVMMPEMNGLEVLRRIRKSSHVPVILVTARSETYDKVAGLDVGADDYISKPFVMEELLARIRSLLRRKNEWSNDTSSSDISKDIATTSNETEEPQNYMLSLGDISINTKSCTVTVAQKVVTLTKTEYDLLCLFVTHRNEALTRDTIINSVWGEERFIEPGAVDVYVRYLRAKIDADAKNSHITTLRGIGYIMKDDGMSAADTAKI